MTESDLSSPVEKLKQIVSCEDLCNVYEEYLVKHYAWENFGFWYEVEAFRKLQSPEEIKEQARLIFYRFLTVDSIFELGDLEPSVREIIAKKLDTPTVNLFDRLQCRVLKSLAQATICEFLTDDLYKDFLTIHSKK